MRSPNLSFALRLITSLLFCAGLQAQIIAPLSGQVTVRLIEGLDSASVQPGTASHAVVLKSTNSAIPKNAQATVLLGVDPSSGVLGIQLVQLVVGAQQVRTSSTGAALGGGGFLGNMNNALNKLDSKTNNQQMSLTGPHVLLPPNTVIQFTLIPPSAQTPGPAQQQTRVRTPPAPVVPKHPAPTVVDLAPAFPGAPPLHASRVASDGCWWEPFGSRSLGYELPVQHCSNPQEDSVYQETPTGLSFSFHKGEPLEEGFTILSKSATQTVQASIKARFLKAPGDQASCVVKKFSDPGNFETYGVNALRSKKTRCAGLYQPDSDATEATAFFYNPVESTTKYIKFTGESISAYPFDLQALHFFDPQALSAATPPPTSSVSAIGDATGPQWTEKAGKSTDTGPNVIAPGTLALNGKTTPVFFYLACANDPALGNNVVELRVVAPDTPGLPASGRDMSVRRSLKGIPKPPPDDSINFNNVVHAGQYTVFYLQTTTEPFTMLDAQVSPQETLVYTWKGQGTAGVFQLPLPPPNAPLNALLDRCQFIRDGHGKVSPAFAQQLTPVLREIGLTKAGGAYSPNVKNQLDNLSKMVKNTDEQSELVFLNEELQKFIQMERAASATLKRKRCVQELVTQAASSEYKPPKTCNDISNGMYE